MIDSPQIKIAIASGKGGTGKTLVSTNLLYTLQQQEYRVTLVDCDAEEPNDLVFLKGNLLSVEEVTQKVPVIDESKCTFCGKCHDYCAYNAIFLLPPAKIIQVIEDLCHGCGACSVACEFDAISEKNVSLGSVSQYSIGDKALTIEARMKVGVFSPVNVIKAAIKKAGNEGIVIMDAPPGTSCPFIHTVAKADFVILVTEPTPFGLSDLKQSIETLKTMNKKYGVIINRAGMGDQGVYEYLKEERIPLLMEIPFDRSIAMHYSKGELVAKENQKFRNELLMMFNSIVEKWN
ncbi:MAG: ATP-binding protein [Bacteroidales bacterium]|nr:ATP-binding protein [Bacteroidales bacterium]